jgi:lipopolysaccharide transport system ATP-binding protein
MNDIVIHCERIGKRYRLGQQRGYRTVRETFMEAMGAPWRWLRRSPADASKAGRADPWIWALRDVSFTVRQGEVLGIIGRNGAGKSTLLKILSRITDPSEGSATIRGRVGSLLEVGTAFHPELSGRENIFLNGAVLGMKRVEILSKFDEIVAFAELEQFVDTAVKRYSSGMYMRLAFAVAAHLEPEVLLVDEVLAVGDARFQKKCLNKMESVGQEGRTVFFVSHNMSTVTRLCQRAILLDGGRLVADGPAHQVVSTYLDSGLGNTAQREWTEFARSPGNDIVRLIAVRVRNNTGEIRDSIDIRRPLTVEMEFDVLKAGHVLVPNLHFFNDEGICAFAVSDQGPEWRGRPRSQGRYLSTVSIPGNFLAEGAMVVHVAISTMDPVEVHVYEEDAVVFHVVDSMDGDSARADYAGPFPGLVRPMLNWTTEYEPAAERALPAKENG